MNSSEDTPPPGAKTILVVDDDDQNRKLFRIVLTRAEYLVIEAPTGAQGVELARTCRPHLILMDLRLPDMDGLEATRMIKADPALSTIPIVAFTAYAMKEDRDRAEKAGCSGYLTKPVDIATLRAEVGRWLADSGARVREG